MFLLDSKLLPLPTYQMSMMLENLNFSMEYVMNTVLMKYLYFQIGVPCGTFFLDDESLKKPLVLLSAGVGLTPLISMLEHALANGDKDKLDITLIQSFKSKDLHPLKRRVANLALANAKNLKSYVFYSEASSDDALEGTKIFHKRLEKKDFEDLVPERDNCIFYFCGPDSYNESIREILTELGISADRMKTESFGPA